MTESCVLIWTSLFDLTSSRLQQLGLWTSCLRLPLFGSWNVPSQLETFGRSDAEKHQKSLRLLWMRLHVSVLYVLISHCSPAPHISPQFLGRFDVLAMRNLTSSSCILRSFERGRHLCPFGILTDEVGQLSFNEVARKRVFSEHYSQI